MNRRYFLLGLASAGLAACAPAAVEAARFEPTRFSVQVTGSGPDVLLIPGLTSGREVWRRAVEANPGYRYHLVQVAGFAGEPVRGNATGPVVEPLAGEIARYIADRGLVRPALIGHSMGGTLAMLIAARHPSLVGRVMVVDMLPQPAGLFGGTAAGFGGLLDDMVATPRGRRLIGSIMTAFTPPDSRQGRSDPDLVARATHELAALDLAPLLPRIRAPLTIVYASPDAQAAAATDRQFAAAYARAPQARRVRIDGSGHMVMLDRPAAFAGAMAEFLEGGPAR